MNWKHTTVAILSASALTCAFAINPPQPNSQGSKGDFTPAQEGKSSNPVPPATIATSAQPSGMGGDYSKSDKALADKIVDALNSDSALQGSKITVLAENGDVTLSGSVMNSKQATKADHIAARKAARVTSALTVGKG